MRGHDDNAIIDADPCWGAESSDCICVQYYVVPDAGLIASGYVVLAVRGKIPSNGRGSRRRTSLSGGSIGGRN